MNVAHEFDTDQLPARKGLCEECVERHDCPMPQAIHEMVMCPSDPTLSIDLPSFESGTLVWCPFYG